MRLNIHLNFRGDCKEAFAHYEKAFGTTQQVAMTYTESPLAGTVPANWGHKIMHAALPLGRALLMGSDARPGCGTPSGGFQVSIESQDEGEVRRVFEALTEGGSVQMPLERTFWSPLFGMCTDKYGVAWMIALSKTDEQPFNQ